MKTFFEQRKPETPSEIGERLPAKAWSSDTKGVMTYIAYCRIAFETEQIEASESRLEILQKTVISEKRRLEALEEQKANLETEIAELEASAESAKAVLAELQESLAESQTALESVKKTTSKASKAYDKAIKEVAAFNDSIEKLASERFAIYKRCKLEEIDVPLKKGSLEAVPLDEVCRCVQLIRSFPETERVTHRIFVMLRLWTSMGRAKTRKTHGR